GRGCDDGPMTFSELSRSWRARGHSNPRGGLLLCHGFTGSPQSLRPWARGHADRGWDADLPLLPGHGGPWQRLPRTAWEDGRGGGHSNPRGGLRLCHGSTGSPQPLRPWAQDHADRGWDVDLPLLPGHGSTWQQMARTTWQDWYGRVHDAALDLSREHGPIAVGGLSMGGALTLTLAADPDLEGRIAAVVLVNPGLTLPPAARLAPLIAPFVPSLEGIGSDIALEGAHEEAYDRVPMRGVANLRRLFSRARSQLSEVRVPVLLATSTVDHTVRPSDSDL